MLKINMVGYTKVKKKCAEITSLVNYENYGEKYG